MARGTQAAAPDGGRKASSAGSGARLPQHMAVGWEAARDRGAAAAVAGTAVAGAAQGGDMDALEVVEDAPEVAVGPASRWDAAGGALQAWAAGEDGVDAGGEVVQQEG